MLGLAPFASFLNGNRADAALQSVALWALALVAPAAVVVVVAGMLFGARRSGDLAALLGVGLFMLFNFEILREAIRAQELPLAYAYALWALTFVVAVAGTRRLMQAPPSVAVVVPIVATAMTLGPALDYARFRATAKEAPTVATSSAMNLGDVRHRPNVYFFLLDAYASSDVLRKRYGYSNRRFLDDLHGLGFRVQSRATANYLITALSLSSILQMRYVGGTPRGERINLSSYRKVLGGDNATVATFRSLGYRYVHAPPGAWDETSCSGREDWCVQPPRDHGIRVGATGRALIGRTPFPSVLDAFPEPPEGRSRPDHVVERLHSERFRSPFFLLMHSVLAHAPHLLRGPACDRVHVKSRDLNDETGDDPRAYVAGIECTDTTVSSAVRSIIRRDPTAIIVLQADHGASPGLNWKIARWKWPAHWTEDRRGVLSALRLPPGCRQDVPDDTTAVNVMRIVFGCIRGRPLRLVEPRYFATNAPRTEVREVR